jgi:hypothetical protein
MGALRWDGYVARTGRQGMHKNFGQETYWKMTTWKTEIKVLAGV